MKYVIQPHLLALTIFHACNITLELHRCTDNDLLGSHIPAED